MKSQVSDRFNYKEVLKLRRQSIEVAALLKQLSHPQRLLILCALSEGEKSVRELENACESSQSAVSQFLKGMRLEGLIESRRDGKQVIYSIKDPHLLKLIKSLYEIFCK